MMPLVAILPDTSSCNGRQNAKSSSANDCNLSCVNLADTTTTTTTSSSTTSSSNNTYYNNDSSSSSTTTTTPAHQSIVVAAAAISLQLRGQQIWLWNQ